MNKHMPKTQTKTKKPTPTKQKNTQRNPKEPTPLPIKVKKKKSRKSRPHTYLTLSSLTRLIIVKKKLTHTYTQNEASTTMQNGFHKHNVSFLKRQSTKKLQKVNLA